MKFLSVPFLLALSLFAAPLHAQDNSLDHTNVAYVELGGMADFWSLNYERVLKINDDKKLSALTGRGGIGPNLGKVWLFGTLNYVQESRPMWGKKNMFTEVGAGPILRREFGVGKWVPYAGVYGGIRQHPTDASPWLVKFDFYLLFARDHSFSDILDFAFPTIGITVGRSF